MPTSETVAELLERAAAAIKADGQAMRARALEWRSGPAAANLDPDRRGWRYEPCGDPGCQSCPHPIPADPTGERANRRDEPARVAEALDRALAETYRAVGRLVALHGLLMPAQPKRPRTLREIHAAGADVAREGWCRSCWRDEQHMTPITLRPTGEPYYRDRCAWCGEFVAAYGQEPPVAVLRKRHEGRRISEEDIARALQRTRSNKAS